MKVNYQETLEKAKEAGFITPEDKYVFCSVAPKEGKRSGSFVEMIYYKYNILFVINPKEVKLIDIDQKTGSIVGTHNTISRENINELSDHWYFFSRDFYLEAQNSNYRENLLVPGKFKGFKQKELLLEVRNLIKQEFKNEK